MSPFPAISLALCICLSVAGAQAGGAPGSALPAEGLVLDLDASRGVVLEEGDRVGSWRNQAPAHPDMVFVKRDEGRKEAGSGRPTLRRNATPDGRPALVFLQQELVCMDEDAFDGLTKGKGHTWIAVIAVHAQRVGVEDVNSFFGNLRNGGKYEGVWGCLDDDNTVWWGARNGRSFGRFDTNNPKVSGPVLAQGKFHVVAGRMDAGTGTVRLALFANSAQPAATKNFPVDPAANPSRMAIGQERDAIEHPGKESFDGEISRLLVWDRPLEDGELAGAMEALGVK